MATAEGGLMILDGTQLLPADLTLPTIPTYPIKGSLLLDLACSAASSSLHGLSLPETLKSAALARLSEDGVGGDLLSRDFNEGEAAEAFRSFVSAVADQLKDDPLVVAVLDGNALRIFLDDEDDFAMLAEDLFTDLDTEDKESGDLLNNILKKHGTEGEEELGQAQFAQLLQPIIQDLADALSENRVVAIQNIKVLNGSKIRKVLADEKLLIGAIEGVFEDPNVHGNGGIRERISGFLEKNWHILGLPEQPLSQSCEALNLLYEHIYSRVDNKKTIAELDKTTFGAIVKEFLENLAKQLETNPIFLDMEI
ncbi:hypothetical protein QJS04_geneDACA021850 [Acorus gramineus]|uniref:Uncharacterized protein n=1 Tax=Acorus gramineus TaxID=55184 RepID=A0AAV9ATV9_ACOGR|nr:hypothetical protein QJS04_geneDACA021850 [Acorus gramineus]